MRATKPALKRPAMPGAGRPTLSEFGPMKRCQVMLDSETILAAQALGDGNLSAGIREAVRISAKQQK